MIHFNTDNYRFKSTTASYQHHQPRTTMDSFVVRELSETGSGSTADVNDGPTAADCREFYAICCKRFTHINLRGLSYEWFKHVFGPHIGTELVEMFERVESALRSIAPEDVICPAVEQIWRWSTLLRPEDVRVIILGQDPYHTVINDRNGDYVRVADGLAFSVNPEYRARCRNLPPSLRNIARLAAPTVYKQGDFHGDLTGWCRNGVLLLDCTLTTLKGKSGAHSKIGWNRITDLIISSFGSSGGTDIADNSQQDRKVFMLWGSDAKKKARLIDKKAHQVLTSCHPSPLSAYRHGWFDNNHFQTANLCLEAVGKKPINWALEDGENL